MTAGGGRANTAGDMRNTAGDMRNGAGDMRNTAGLLRRTKEVAERKLLEKSHPDRPASSSCAPWHKQQHAAHEAPMAGIHAAHIAGKHAQANAHAARYAALQPPLAVHRVKLELKLQLQHVSAACRPTTITVCAADINRDMDAC